MTRRVASLSAIAALLMSLLGATAALAHAQLRSAEPRAGAVVATAPEATRLVFNEPVSPLQVRWVTPDGVVHDATARAEGSALVVEPPPFSGTGTLVLSWRVVSEDGHPVGGSHAFSIGAPSANAEAGASGPGGPAVAAAIAKFLLTTALAIAAGGAFALAAFAPAGQPTETPARGTALARTLARWAAAAIVPAAALLAAATALDLAAAAPADLLGAEPWRLLARSPALGAIAMALAAGALAWLALSGPAPLLAGAAALGAAALSFALSGHAASAEPRWLAVPAIALHAGAALFWIGALPVLLALTASGDRAGALALARFSSWATAPVAALFLAGAALAWLQIGDAAAPLTHAYAWLLAAKAICAFAMLGLAGLNRWRLAPALASGGERARRAASRSLAAEIAIALAIVALASAFRVTPPPRAASAPEAAEAYVHLHGARAMADVTASPGRAGANDLTASLLDDAFAPLEAEEVVLRLSPPVAGLEDVEARLAREADGAWRARDVALPFAGAWGIRVEILVDAFTREVVAGELTVAP